MIQPGCVAVLMGHLPLYSAVAGCVLPLTGVLLMGSNAVHAKPPAAGAASCIACHASASVAVREDKPPGLDVLSVQEIETALSAFRAGTRSGTVMPRIARGYTAQEVHEIASSLARDGEVVP